MWSILPAELVAESNIHNSVENNSINIANIK